MEARDAEGSKGRRVAISQIPIGTLADQNSFRGHVIAASATTGLAQRQASYFLGRSIAPLELRRGHARYGKLKKDHLRPQPHDRHA
jgi:hypothetical protein